MLELIYIAVVWILPACFANATPVLLGGGAPIDFKKKLKGKRILGDNKTIRGTLSGIVVGTLTGLAFGKPELGMLLGMGAILGDLAGSFLKRRVDIKPGKSFPLLDQYDFLLGALLFASFLEFPSWETLVIMLIVVPLLHLAANFGAYLLGLKKVWW
ncbi:MAG: CDP-2,3-bis-(O-geranylgeranyl)-sn-glycerol synthase [archaeon]